LYKKYGFSEVIYNTFETLILLKPVSLTIAIMFKCILSYLVIAVIIICFDQRSFGGHVELTKKYARGYFQLL